MSFKINYQTEKIIATFKDNLENLELTKAFFEMIETVSIININYLIFDLTDITSYTIPENYIEKLKLNTQFSTSWNSNIAVIFIATNSEIRQMVTGFINHNEDLKWEYHLFDDMENVKKNSLKFKPTII